jgi:hypothetical protein
MPECCDAKLLQVLFRQARKNRLLYLILTECRFILREAHALAISVAVSGGSMGKSREPQIILKTDQRNAILELGLGGKFQAKSSGWDENRIFLEGAALEVAVRNGRCVINPRSGRTAPGTASGPALFSDRGVTV